eukprot:TRINITY_DN925_c0_g1_i1.p1 TRINITY_DN925_c0_g1~~TRINITY_DN925_c0_g1_i1.p1  ORF type:complete len:130 (+),score=34.85 TRINITY_DN925_c0_g1_i1:125-514(+)
MSWQEYVDNLVAGGKVQHAALLGIDGSVWAQTKDFALTAEEAAGVAGGMGEASGAYFQANGCTCAGTKYFTLRHMGDEGLYYGKKGAAGICIARSTQCLVVGIYGEGQTPGDANIAVEGVKDYLVSVSY